MRIQRSKEHNNRDPGNSHFITRVASFFGGTYGRHARQRNRGHGQVQIRADDAVAADVDANRRHLLRTLYPVHQEVHLVPAEHEAPVVVLLDWPTKSCFDVNPKSHGSYMK